MSPRRPSWRRPAVICINFERDYPQTSLEVRNTLTLEEKFRSSILTWKLKIVGHYVLQNIFFLFEIPCGLLFSIRIFWQVWVNIAFLKKRWRFLVRKNLWPCFLSHEKRCFRVHGFLILCCEGIINNYLFHERALDMRWLIANSALSSSLAIITREE